MCVNDDNELTKVIKNLQKAFAQASISFGAAKYYEQFLAA